MNQFFSVSYKREELIKKLRKNCETEKINECL